MMIEDLGDEITGGTTIALLQLLHPLPRLSDLHSRMEFPLVHGLIGPKAALPLQLPTHPYHLVLCRPHLLLACRQLLQGFQNNNLALMCPP